MRLTSLILGATLAGIGTVGVAHEFKVGLYQSGPRTQSRLGDVVRGFLLAADERDGHADETSDGHLGGVDVQILPMPIEFGDGIEGLHRRRAGAPEVIVVFGDTPAQDLPTGVPIFEAGALAPKAVWQQSDFAARYQALYGTAPSPDAAQGYNEARRLDHAIRPIDGFLPTSEFRAAIASTAGGMEW